MRCLNANAREAMPRICCLQVETCGSKYKKRGAHTHAAFRLSLEGARARSQADHVRLRGIAALSYNVAIASLGRGDEGLGSWLVGIEVSRHAGVQGYAGLTAHPRRAPRIPLCPRFKPPSLTRVRGDGVGGGEGWSCAVKLCIFCG